MNPILPLDHGITCIDSGYYRPRFDAFYLIVEQGRAAIVDTGTGHSAAIALQALERLGIDRGQVDYVMPTHVHLDHAGGAGALMAALPNARLVAHPRGAPHLVDPSRLIDSSTAVYGEAEMQRLFGEILPVPAERVVESTDGTVIDLAGRPLELLHTEGHARHHYCVWDAASRGLFTGDTFGISYRELDTAQGPYLFATTTPVQFDPDAWLATVDRLAARDPEWVYLAHFGRLGDVGALAARLRRDLCRKRDGALALASEPDVLAALRALVENDFFADLDAHGAALERGRVRELLAMDIDLNAQGLLAWLERRKKTERTK